MPPPLSESSPEPRRTLPPAERCRAGANRKSRAGRILLGIHAMKSEGGNNSAKSDERVSHHRRRARARAGAAHGAGRRRPGGGTLDAIRLAPPAFSGAPALVTWRSALPPLPRLPPPPPTSVSVAGDRQRNLGIRGRCLTLGWSPRSSQAHSPSSLNK